MGHAKELITVDVYGDNANIMPEEILELLSYMEDVLPGREKECGMKPDVLDTVIDVGLYLPRKDSEQD